MAIVFDASVLQTQPNIPQPFIWPDHDRPQPTDQTPELAVPLIDLTTFLTGDSSAVSETSRVVHEACKKHGFFVVKNHGVDPELIRKAHEQMDSFFGLQLSEKQRAQRKVGDHCGYASSFTGRFLSKLPWKETLSFRYVGGEEEGENPNPNCVQEYFGKVMGNEFKQFG